MAHTDMTDLIERLEKATGPDREIDHDIRKTVEGWHENTRLTQVPLYTTSIDAALTLVPEGVHWQLRTSEVPGWFTSCWGDFGVTWAQYSAASPAIALCIAALKARAI